MNVIAKEFNALAPEYENNRLAPWYKAHADEILAASPSRTSGDVLDIGCGTGYLLRAYLKRNPGTRGLGLDISRAMVEEARQIAESDGIGNVRFVNADWESPDEQPLINRPFDLVFCANAFHYFSAPRDAARKMFNAMASGGSLLVLERNASNSVLTRGWGWLHRHCIKDNVEFHTEGDLLSCFRNAGFASASTVRSINRLLWKNKLYTSVVLIECRKY